MTALTQRQREILVGSILGDGCVSVRKNRNNCWYYVKQCDANKKYLFWLHREFANLCPSGPKQRRDNRQWYFSTTTIGELNWFREKFYPNGKKIIPKDISQILVSPLSVAIWYMDDGTLDYRPCYHCSFSISTHCFSVSGANLLKDTLFDTFGIRARVYNNLIRGVRYPRIYIGSEGRKEFYTLIEPFMLDCFRYKLPPEFTL